VAHIRTGKVLSRLGLAAFVAVIPGCSRGTLLERSGVEVKPPDSWRSVRPGTWMVPGTPLAAWSGPDGSSLVIYRTLWVPGGSAEMLAEAMANRLGNLPGAKLVVRRSETVAGIEAARLEMTAPGTGDALVPSGLGEPIKPEGKALVATRQVTIAFALSTETIYMTWHMVEGSHEKIEPDIRATLASVRFHSRAETSYQK
jgi:hypothetical protein